MTTDNLLYLDKLEKYIRKIRCFEASKIKLYTFASPLSMDQIAIPIIGVDSIIPFSSINSAVAVTYSTSLSRL